MNGKEEKKSSGVVEALAGLDIGGAEPAPISNPKEIPAPIIPMQTPPAKTEEPQNVGKLLDI